MMITINPQHQQGWECPKCGNVYAPWIWACTDCNNPKFETTVSSGTITICSHIWSDTTAPHCELCGVPKHHVPEWSWTVTTESPGNDCSQKNGNFESSQTPGNITFTDALECTDEPIIITRFLDGSLG